MGYCRARLVMALVFVLVLVWNPVGSCSRATKSGGLFHTRTPYSNKAKVLNAAMASSMDSQTIPVKVKRCGKLCRFIGAHTSLVKGPLPPSGPSRRGNSVPNNR